MNAIEEYNKNIFENIKHIDELGNEYWLARELIVLLEYKKMAKILKCYRICKKCL